MEQRTQYRQQGNQPQAAAPANQSAGVKTAYVSQAGKNQPSKIKKFWWVPVVVLAVGALAVWFLFGGNGASQVNGSKYQAVFLNNGQVYFGKLHGFYTERPYLTDVYYIQAPDGTAAQDEKATDASTQKLIKLGKEIHGPENKLILNKDSVLFVENLNDDSNVVKAIKSDSGQ